MNRRTFSHQASACLIGLSVAPSSYSTERGASLADSGEYFPEAVRALSPALLRPGLGQAAFPTSTTSPQAREWFQQGVVLLYSEWEIEALRSFREAIRLDESFAMAWWGVAMSMPGPQHEWKAYRAAALAKAASLAPKATERERGWIVAGEKLANGGTPAAVPAWQALARDFADDLNARLWLASLARDPLGTPVPESQPPRSAQQNVAIRLVEEVLQRSPTHLGASLTHVRILLGSNELSRAMGSAQRLISLGPNNPSALGLAGQALWLLGQKKQAHEQFLAAEKLDLAYLKSEQTSYINHPRAIERLNALAMLEASLRLKKEALSKAQVLEGIEIPTDRGTSLSAHLHHLLGKTLRTRLHLLWREWNEASQAAAWALEKPGMTYAGQLAVAARIRAAMMRGEAKGAIASLDEFKSGLNAYTSALVAPQQRRDAHWSLAVESLGVLDALLSAEVALLRGVDISKVESLFLEARQRSRSAGRGLLLSLIAPSAEQEAAFWKWRKEPTRETRALEAVREELPQPKALI